MRVIYRGEDRLRGFKGDTPEPGSSGVAWPAFGFDDPESAEQGAYLFQADGDENAYYVDPERDLIFDLPEAVSHAEPL